jgi:hypothetical protein
VTTEPNATRLGAASYAGLSLVLLLISNTLIVIGDEPMIILGIGLFAAGGVVTYRCYLITRSWIGRIGLGFLACLYVTILALALFKLIRSF